MKTLIQFLLATFTILACVCCKTAKEEKTDDKLNEITFADPTIFVENGKYYLTGTRNREPNGFAIFESTDLKEWKTANGDTLQLILRKGDSAYGERGFWAPQLFKEGNRYYLTYTANEHTALASSNSVYGPFRQDSIRPIDETAKNIDSFLFKDSDGKYYLYHVRFNKGNYLWVAEFDLQKGCIKPETLKKCFDNTEAWERTPNYKSAPVMEGPTVVKLDDLYYLFYWDMLRLRLLTVRGRSMQTILLFTEASSTKTAPDMGICLKVWTEDITMYIMFIIQIQLCSRVRHALFR